MLDKARMLETQGWQKYNAHEAEMVAGKGYKSLLL